MGNIIRRGRNEDESRSAAIPFRLRRDNRTVNVRRHAQPTPIADELDEKVTATLKQIEAPYQSCINNFRDQERRLNRLGAYIMQTIIIESPLYLKNCNGL